MTNRSRLLFENLGINDDFLDEPAEAWIHLSNYQTAISVIKDTLPAVNDIVERTIDCAIRAIDNLRVQNNERLNNFLITMHFQ